MNRKQRFANSVNEIAKKRVTDLSIQEASEDVTPYAYCTVVMALKEMTDMEQEDIVAIITRSQEIWRNWEYGCENPIDVCHRLTNIWLVNKEQAKGIGEA